MKRFLLLILVLTVWSLPAPVQSWDNTPADLKPQNIQDRVRRDRQRLDSLRAKQGEKAFNDTMKQHQKNQEDMKKIMDTMNRR